MSLMEIPLPPGLLYFPNWLSDTEHDAAVLEIDGHNFETSLSRRVQHYGARYHYDSSRVAEIGSAPPAPKVLSAIGKRLFNEHDFERIPEQIIVNEYLRGQSIAAHIDRDSFGPKVATISLLESWYMTFRSLDKLQRIEVFLEKNSLAIMTEASRTQWKHAIMSRVQDKSSAGIDIPRGRRLSLTFRTINRPEGSSH